MKLNIVSLFNKGIDCIGIIAIERKDRHEYWNFGLYRFTKESNWILYSSKCRMSADVKISTS
jgi:hypothetical protein